MLDTPHAFVQDANNKTVVLSDSRTEFTYSCLFSREREEPHAEFPCHRSRCSVHLTCRLPTWCFAPFASRCTLGGHLHIFPYRLLELEFSFFQFFFHLPRVSFVAYTRSGFPAPAMTRDSASPHGTDRRWRKVTRANQALTHAKLEVHMPTDARVTAAWLAWAACS